MKDNTFPVPWVALPRKAYIFVDNLDGNFYTNKKFCNAMRTYKNRFGQFAPESLYQIIWDQANHVPD